MTNNKTELQEAIYRIDKFLLEWPKMSNKGNGIYGLNSGDEDREAELNYNDIKLVVSKLRACADLPEKIEGMKGKCDVANRDYNQALDDILNLIKEG